MKNQLFNQKLNMIMKRLVSLLVAVFFMTGMVVAQNNTATTTQNGNGNNAEVEQLGKDHESIIDQDTWGEGHDAVVHQNSGDNNYSNLTQTQRGADATVDQIGSDNQSRLNQHGPNDAEIYQEGDGNVVGSYSDLQSKAWQKNGNSFPSDKNFLDVDQVGNNNKAGVWQEHHAEATILQEGSANEAYVKQQSNPAGGTLNWADIDQDGTENFADIYQKGEGNDANVRHQQNSNESYQHIEGNNNYTNGNLHGDNNVTDQTQIGNGNWSYAVASYGAVKNTIKTEQYGSDNYAKGRVTSSYSSVSKDNTMNIVQDGDMNKSYNLIEGSHNDIDVLQDGKGNIAGTHTDYGIIQMGDHNVADLDQLSNNNNATIHQYGNHNTANVIQD
jgi:hypothetical protein